MFHALWSKPTDAGVFTGGNWREAGGFSLANLTGQDVTEPTRSVDAAPASTWWRVDCARVVPLSMFVMLAHNGSKRATRRYLVSNTPDGSAPVYDTGAQRLRVPTTVWGSQAFGTFPFDGIDEDAYPAGTIDLHVAPSTVFGRYVFVQVNDPDNPAGYFQAGRFMAGEAWRHDMQPGTRIRTVDPSEVRRTRGGRRIVRRKPAYREISISFGYMSAAAAWGGGFEIERQLGKSGDFVAVYDPGDDPSIRFRRALYCALSDTVGVTATDYDQYAWGLTAEELT